MKQISIFHKDCIKWEMVVAPSLLRKYDLLKSDNLKSTTNGLQLSLNIRSSLQSTSQMNLQCFIHEHLYLDYRYRCEFFRQSIFDTTKIYSNTSVIKKDSF